MIHDGKLGEGFERLFLRLRLRQETPGDPGDAPGGLRIGMRNAAEDRRRDPRYPPEDRSCTARQATQPSKEFVAVLRRQRICHTFFHGVLFEGRHLFEFLKTLAFVDLGSPSTILAEALFKELQLDQKKPLTFYVGEMAVQVEASQVTTDTWLPFPVADNRRVEALLPAG